METKISDKHCNLLVIGQTGVGKSSLLNYLIGKKVFETGSGKPVTKVGIFKEVAEVDGKLINVYDSYGLEKGKYDVWYDIIGEELLKHGISKPPTEWFHIVLYCIRAGSARFEPEEKDFICNLVQKGYFVTVIITHADQLEKSPEKLDSLKNCINNELGKMVRVIPVVASDESKRGGTKSQKRGREEVLESVFENWIKTINAQLPKHIIIKLKNDVDNFSEQLKLKYCNADCVDPEDTKNISLYAKIEQEYKDFKNNLPYLLDNYIKDALDECGKISDFIIDTFKWLRGKELLVKIKEKLKNIKEDLKRKAKDIFHNIRNWVGKLFNRNGMQNNEINKAGGTIDELSKDLKEEIEKMEFGIREEFVKHLG